MKTRTHHDSAGYGRMKILQEFRVQNGTVLECQTAFGQTIFVSIPDSKVDYLR